MIPMIVTAGTLVNKVSTSNEAMRSSLLVVQRI